MVRKHYRLMVLLEMAVCVMLAGVAEESSTDACLHSWVPYDQAVHGTSQYKTILSRTDPDGHCFVGFYPANVCALCGACAYANGGGSYAYHAYRVTGCVYDDAGENVTITWMCELCSYERTESVPVQSILAGEHDTCLLGGACDERMISRYMHDGVILDGTMPAEWLNVEKEWFRAVIYDMETGGFMCETRKYCVVCGRPGVYDDGAEYGPFHEQWSGLPVMTLDYFLNAGVPQSMPYRLIDEIRSEHHND